MGGLVGGLFIGALGAIFASGGISDVAGVLEAFFTAITDGTMWRSLAWLLMGVGLIAGGLTLWAKTTVYKAGI